MLVATDPAASDPAKWANGWYRPAHHLASPNFGPRPQSHPIDMVVLHSISLPPGDYANRHVQDLFTNQLDWELHPYFKKIEGLEVSSHFFIERSGQLWQFVSCDDRAWHAGVSSYRGRDNCNDDSIGIELQGLEGDVFEEVQYTTLISLCLDIAQQYPICHIAGHEHIAPERKADPGSGFDWVFLQQRLPLNSQCFPVDVRLKEK